MGIINTVQLEGNLTLTHVWNDSGLQVITAIPAVWQVGACKEPDSARVKKNMRAPNADLSSLSQVQAMACITSGLGWPLDHIKRTYSLKKDICTYILYKLFYISSHKSYSVEPLPYPWQIKLKVHATFYHARLTCGRNLLVVERSCTLLLLLTLGFIFSEVFEVDNGRLKGTSELVERLVYSK